MQCPSKACLATPAVVISAKMASVSSMNMQKLLSCGCARIDNLGKYIFFEDSGSKGGMIFSARNQGDISQPEEQLFTIFIK